MKKKVFSWMLVLILVLGMALSVSANEGFVYDEAGLLTEAERSALEQTLSSLSSTYDAQIVVATIAASGGVDMDTLVEFLYDNAPFGYGENRDGVLLLVCMDPREYRILCNGYCADAMDPDTVGNAIVSDLSNDDFANAFDAFAGQCEYYLDGHINGFPFNFGMNLLIALVVGLIAGVMTAKSLKGQLKTVRKQEQANSYVKPGSMNIHAQNDVFLYRDIDRTRKESDSSDRSSGGSSRSIGGGSF